MTLAEFRAAGLAVGRGGRARAVGDFRKGPNALSPIAAAREGKPGASNPYLAPLPPLPPRKAGWNVEVLVQREIVAALREAGFPCLGINAEERISRLMDECDAPLREHANSMLSPIFARTGEHALRTALVAAIAKNPWRPALDLPTLEWAIEVVRACERFLVEQVERHVADTEHEGKVKKVLDVIRKAGGWIDGSTLAKRTLFINAKERNETVRQLEEAGEIERRTGRPASRVGWRPRTLLRIVK